MLVIHVSHINASHINASHINASHINASHINASHFHASHIHTSHSYFSYSYFTFSSCMYINFHWSSSVLFHVNSYIIACQIVTSCWLHPLLNDHLDL